MTHFVAQGVRKLAHPLRWPAQACAPLALASAGLRTPCATKCVTVAQESSRSQAVINFCLRRSQDHGTPRQKHLLIRPVFRTALEPSIFPPFLGMILLILVSVLDTVFGFALVRTILGTQKGTLDGLKKSKKVRIFFRSKNRLSDSSCQTRFGRPKRYFQRSEKIL